MDEEARIRLAVEAFPSLQGLRWVPLGLAFALNPWFQHPPYWDIGVALLWFGIGCAGFAVVGRWYGQHFGFRRLRPRSVGRTALSVLAFVALFGGIYFYGYWEMRLGLRVSGWALMWAAIFGMVFASAPRLRWYWGAFMLLFLGCSVVPALGLASTEELFGQFSRIGAALVGLGIVVCGLLDHRLLVSLLPPVDEGGESELAG